MPGRVDRRHRVVISRGRPPSRPTTTPNGTTVTDDTIPQPPDGDDTPPASDPAGGVATETPPAPTTGTAPFARSSSDRVAAGLAGAIAARLDADPALVRVVAVVLAVVSGGIVVPAYLLGWVLIARDDDPAPRLYEHVAVRDGGFLMWAAAAVLSLALLGSIADPWQAPGGFPLLPLVLIGVGVALWTRGDRGDRTSGGTWPASAAPPPPPGPTWAATGDRPTTDTTTGSTTMPLDTTTPPTTPVDGDAGGGTPPAGPRRPLTTPPAPRAPRPPRERSVLGAVTIALALIAAGVAAALDASGVLAVELGATGVLSIAVLTIGLGLLVGTVWGRARWLLLVGLLLMPFLALGVVVEEAQDAFDVDVDVSAGLGERRVELDGDERLPERLELFAGQIDVDLEDWAPTGDELAALDGDGADLEIVVGAGEVDLTLPADVAWRVTSELGLGEYRVRGEDVRLSETVEETWPLDDGETFGTDFVRTGGPADGPVLDVLVDVGAGQITIRETTPTTSEELS